jgi:hypothetical protein
MPQNITRTHYHPAGEFNFKDHHAISISPCTPSELGALCDEIELRNLSLSGVGVYFSITHPG